MQIAERTDCRPKLINQEGNQYEGGVIGWVITDRMCDGNHSAGDV